MKIFVASLPFNIMEEDLRAAFAVFGVVAIVKIIADKALGRSKGYGLIEMPDDGCALAAISALNGAGIHGRTMVVSKAEDNLLHRVNIFQATAQMVNRTKLPFDDMDIIKPDHT
jgi:RNA recognition motif-containing protein